MRALALAVLVLGQDPLDDLLRGLGDDDPTRREACSRRILERWDRWTEDELARLRTSSAGSDAELAGRARELLHRVTFRRAMGSSLLSGEPDLERIVRQGSRTERAELLVRICDRWMDGTIEEAKVRVLAERAAAERWFPQMAELSPLTACIDRFRGAPGKSSHPFARLMAAFLEDPDGATRKAAVETLGRMGAREHAASIARRLRDEDESVVGAALLSLNRLLAVDQFGWIVPLLKKPGLREPAALVLGQTVARRAAVDVRFLLDDSDAATRAAAASVLGGMGAFEHATAVAALLESDDAALLIRAADALGRMAEPAHAERVAKLLKHDDPFVRATAAQALGRMRDPRYAGALLPLLRDPVTDVRDFAGAALGEILPEEKVAEVAALLVDRDAVVRGLSARALGQAGVGARAKDITQVLDWEHPWSRGRALRALGALGAVEHLDRLIDLTRDEWDVVRISAAAALCDLAPLPWPDGKKARAIEKLREARKDFGDEAPHAAAVALVLLEGGGLPAQREALELLDEKDAEIIPVLVDGLARLHEPKGRAALDRETLIEKPVDSIERLKEELARAGLSLDDSDDPRVSGRLLGRWKTTPRKLLAALWEGTVAVPQGDRVRVLDPMRALQHWRDQLRSR